MDSGNQLKRYVVLLLNKQNFERKTLDERGLNEFDVGYRIKRLYPNWLLMTIKEVTHLDEERNE